MVKHSLDQLKLFSNSLDEQLHLRGGGMSYKLRNILYICKLFYPNRRRKDKTQKDLRGEEGEGGEGGEGKGGGGEGGGEGG